MYYTFSEGWVNKGGEVSLNFHQLYLPDNKKQNTRLVYPALDPVCPPTPGQELLTTALLWALATKRTYGGAI